MGIDHQERKERGQGKTGKRGSVAKGGFIMLEHRIFDSPAFLDLSYSARFLLLAVMREYNGSNNGRLRASVYSLRDYGLDSPSTISKGIKQCVENGLLHKTYRGGIDDGYSFFALTWIKLDDTTGLDPERLATFRINAWRKYEPKKNDDAPSKSNTARYSFDKSSPAVDTKTVSVPSIKTVELIDIPFIGCISAVKPTRATDQAQQTNLEQSLPTWMREDLVQLAALGLGGNQCYAIPHRMDSKNLPTWIH